MTEREILSLYFTFIGLVEAHDSTLAGRIHTGYEASVESGADTVAAVLDVIEEQYMSPGDEELPFPHPDYRLIEVPTAAVAALDRLAEACERYIEATNLVREAEGAAGWDPTP